MQLFIFGILQATRNGFTSFTLTAFSNQIYKFKQSLIQNFLINNLINSISNFSRNLSQSFSLNNLIAQYSIFYRNLIQNFNLNNFSSRIFSALRTLSQSFNINNLASYFDIRIKSIIQSFSINNLSNQLYKLNKYLTQTLSITNAANYLRTVSRLISQNFNITNFADKIAIFNRNIFQIISVILANLNRLTCTIGLSCPSGGTTITQGGAGGGTGLNPISYEVQCDSTVCYGCQLRCNLFIKDNTPYNLNASAIFWIEGDTTPIYRTYMLQNSSTNLFTEYIPFDSKQVISYSILNTIVPSNITNSTGTAIFQFSPPFQEIRKNFRVVSWAEKNWIYLAMAGGITVASLSILILQREKLKARIRRLGGRA